MPAATLCVGFLSNVATHAETPQSTHGRASGRFRIEAYAIAMQTTDGAIAMDEKRHAALWVTRSKGSEVRA